LHNKNKVNNQLVILSIDKEFKSFIKQKYHTEKVDYSFALHKNAEIAGQSEVTVTDKGIISGRIRNLDSDNVSGIKVFI